MAEENTFTFSMLEYPFYREGMTIDEWKAERQYMAAHMEDVKKGDYLPMWKQKKMANTLYDMY